MTFFWTFGGGRGSFNEIPLTPYGSCTSQIDLSDEVSNTPNKDRMQKLRPREVDVSTTPIGAHKPFGLSSSRG
jgi:hypothetical protein